MFAKYLSLSALKLCVALVVCSSYADSIRRDYHGFSVIRSLPQTNDQIKQLRALLVESDDDDDISFWKAPTSINRTVDILVSQEQKEILLDKLDGLGVPSRIMIQDLAQMMHNTSRAHNASFSDFSRASFSDTDKFYENFQRYSAIEERLRQLKSRDSRVKLETIGKSFENRDMYLVKISSDHSANKPIIFIDAGHHAREWISHATGMYLLESLINDNMPKMSPKFCKNDLCHSIVSKNVKLNLDDYDYYFVPVVNPDGYEYSHTNNRLWRKNRSTNGRTSCRGTDINRNYPYHYDESGTSKIQCSEVYSGEGPMSEVEVRNIISTMTRYKNRIKMYITLHNYAQMILIPYGYAFVEPRNYKNLKNVADAWIDSVRKLRNTEYQTGIVAEILYPAAGSSDDYALGELGIEYVYTIELPDNGYHGFLIPRSEIIPIAHESLIGLKGMIDKLS